MRYERTAWWDRGIVFAAMMFLLIGSPARAEDDPPKAWAPPTPETSDGFDWIELTSGEWLKGEFRSMYDESVEFDSDILGIVDIDWTDVKQMYFANPMGVRTDNRKVHRGEVEMVDGVITINDDSTAQQDDVVAIAPVAKSEIDRWEAEANIALDFQSGNTDETRYTANISAERRSASTRLRLSYLGNFTKTDGTESANNHRIESTFDYFLDDRIYLRVIDAEYYRDPFQNIDTQLTIGTGIGYKIIDSSTVDWEVLGGPAYQYTQFGTVTAGDSQTVQSPAALLQTTVSWDITDDLNWDNSLQMTITKKDAGLISSNFVSKLEYEINTIFDVFLMLQIDRVQNPTQRSDGSTPEKTDTTLGFGVGVDY